MSESGDNVSWFDRQKAETESNPIERGIKEMLANVKHVETPLDVIDVDSVPELGVGVMQRGIALVAAQGTMISSEHTPLRSDNAADCQYLILQTPIKTNDELQGKYRYDLIHIWAGDLDMNLPGAKIEDIAAITNDETTAIQITHDRNPYLNATARGLKYKGITTTKEIRVHNGNQYVHVVFRPDEDKTLVRIGENEQVQVFEGFSEPEQS